MITSDRRIELLEIHELLIGKINVAGLKEQNGHNIYGHVMDYT